MNQFFGVNILNESEQIGHRGSFRVSFSIGNPKEVKEAEKLQETFDKYYKKLYFDLVTEIHKYMIRITPAHTGQLRGGWTAFLNKHQIDYTKQMYDTSLYDSFKNGNFTPESKIYQFDSASIEMGKSKASVEDKFPADTDVSISNGVEYKDYMDYGTSKIAGRHFTDLARYKGEFLFEQQFNRWLNKMEKAGAVVPADEVPEIGV
jgi:hypothetical protein